MRLLVRRARNASLFLFPSATLSVSRLSGSNTKHQEREVSQKSIMSLSSYFSDLLAEKGLSPPQVTIVIDRHETEAIEMSRSPVPLDRGLVTKLSCSIAPASDCLSQPAAKQVKRDNIKIQQLPKHDYGAVCG